MRKKEHYVATNSIRKFTKTQHVSCSNTQICNKYGFQPSEQCIKAHCPYAGVNEFEIEVTPKGLARQITLFDFVDDTENIDT